VAVKIETVCDYANRLYLPNGQSSSHVTSVPRSHALNRVAIGQTVDPSLSSLLSRDPLNHLLVSVCRSVAWINGQLYFLTAFWSTPWPIPLLAPSVWIIRGVHIGPMCLRLFPSFRPGGLFGRLHRHCTRLCCCPSLSCSLFSFFRASPLLLLFFWSIAWAWPSSSSFLADHFTRAAPSWVTRPHRQHGWDKLEAAQARLHDRCQQREWNGQLSLRCWPEVVLDSSRRDHFVAGFPEWLATSFVIAVKPFDSAPQCRHENEGIQLCEEFTDNWERNDWDSRFSSAARLSQVAATFFDWKSYASIVLHCYAEMHFWKDFAKSNETPPGRSLSL
jgi:hypothetical protein